MLNNEYFNNSSVKHILFLAVLYLIMLLYLSQLVRVDVFSKFFYLNLAICVGYFLGHRSRFFDNNRNSIEAAFHFSGLFFCLWLGLISLLSTEITISKFTGFFLVAGGLCCFNLINELLKILRKGMERSYFRIADVALRIFLFSIFILALYFFIFGEWLWYVKPFYEWKLSDFEWSIGVR